jgi:hypothetical protein
VQIQYLQIVLASDPVQVAVSVSKYSRIGGGKCEPALHQVKGAPVLDFRSIRILIPLYGQATWGLYKKINLFLMRMLILFLRTNFFELGT